MDHERPKRKFEGASATRGSHEEASPPVQQFDVLNWLYWNLWWQQYSYWSVIHQQSFVHQNLTSEGPGNRGPDLGTGQIPTNLGNAGVGPIPAPPWNVTIGMTPFPTPAPQPQDSSVSVARQVVNGYETCIAPLWRRALAELIDTLLFSLLLKFYWPDLDYRIPELIFEGPDMWNKMGRDDLINARSTLMVFIYSTLIQRGVHIIIEALLLSIFACTPGKWLMGIRVWFCTSSPRYTRTTPGFSIRLEPGGKMSFLLALGRSIFKSAVSLFVPLFIFFFQLDKGRTQYDRLFHGVVVDTYSLNKPLHTIVYTRIEGSR